MVAVEQFSQDPNHAGFIGARVVIAHQAFLRFSDIKTYRITIINETAGIEVVAFQFESQSRYYADVGVFSYFEYAFAFVFLLAFAS